ncbi:MAG: hypothetical protein O6941_00160 [Planctomycetota bacterium]|nr:hypothetical protein [Planctomycetota bacterium]
MVTLRFAGDPTPQDIVESWGAPCQSPLRAGGLRSTILQNFASSATMIPDDNSAASWGVGTMPQQPGVLIVQEGP